MSDAGRISILDLTRHRRVWLLAVDGRDAIEAEGEPLCHGFGAPYPKPFSAAFVHDERLWLQVGTQRWDVADIQAVDQEKETIRYAKYLIRLTDGSQQRVVIKFPAGVAALRAIDPTHDEIDSWSEDVMKLLPYTAADGWSADGPTDVAAWAARVLPMWSSGLRPSGKQNDV